MNANEPAFPTSNDIKIGLTKREYFACVAIQGAAAGMFTACLRQATSTEFSVPKSGPLAELAVDLADALLKVLEEKK